MHSLEPGETPSNSASHRAPNYAQRSKKLQNILKRLRFGCGSVRLRLIFQFIYVQFCMLCLLLAVWSIGTCTFHCVTGMLIINNCVFIRISLKKYGVCSGKHRYSHDNNDTTLFYWRPATHCNIVLI